MFLFDVAAIQERIDFNGTNNVNILFGEFISQTVR